MSAPYFTKKSTLNVDNLIDNIDKNSDQIFSSVLFTLVNFPYKKNSIDVKTIFIHGLEFKCYENHYRFSNGTMTIIKTISQDFIPYGIYARRIINFLIAEFGYKMRLPEIYNNDYGRRMVNLGKNPVDFVEKICGTRKVGSNTRKAILQQLQAILNCNIAIATGYQQINPKDDEALAEDRYQFALIESSDDQLINHKFDVFNNWQEKIYISIDIANLFSKYIMPLPKKVYDQITSPMELDIYLLFHYHNHCYLKSNIPYVQYHWLEMMSFCGRGYANTSRGRADFRKDYRKNVDSLKIKVSLDIEAPLNSDYIIFRPKLLTSIADKSPKKIVDWKSIEYQSYKDIIDDLPKIGQKKAPVVEVVPETEAKWRKFTTTHDLNVFDMNAFKHIKRHFDKDSENTIKTVLYVLNKKPKPKSMSAFVIAALTDGWTKKSESFTQKTTEWHAVHQTLDRTDVDRIDAIASQAVQFLVRRYHPEEFQQQVLVLIYTAFYYICKDNAEFLQDLTGSKYKQYFARHVELLGF